MKYVRTKDGIIYIGDLIKDEYELYFIEYKYYKNCFWLKKDKSE